MGTIGYCNGFRDVAVDRGTDLQGKEKGYQRVFMSDSISLIERVSWANGTWKQAGD
jgi:hypothetical protein